MIVSEKAAGRAAADKLALDWENREWVPPSPTAEWARAAVERLGEIMAEQPAMLRASMRGADRGASTLSPRPFQGLVECLQNADDLGATCLHVAYRCRLRPELLIVHDGSPVTLANVAAMLLPWLSTKDSDPDAAGRFGIGQRTLGALGGPVSLHAPPFHFVMAGNGPELCEMEHDVTGVYNSARRDTMLVIPLAETVTCEGVVEAIRELGLDSLVFLKSIRRLHFHHLDDHSKDLAFSIEVMTLDEGRIDFGTDEAAVAIADIRVIEPSNEVGTRLYRRYSTKRTLRAGEKRSNKAADTTTPIGVCVPIDALRRLRLYDRMPFPIATGLNVGLNAQFDPDSARSTLQPNKWNRNRFADLGKLLAWAALEAFKTNTVTAWNHVPLGAEANQGEGWVETSVRELVIDACHAILRERLEICTDSGSIALTEIAYEAEELESLLTGEDVERLRPESVALPQSARDAAVRWRRVLGELDRSEVVPVEDALEIVDGSTDRAAAWYVAFAALAERHGLFFPFIAKPGLLLADGTATARPSSSDVWVIVKHAASDALAVRLGLARRLHPAYLELDAPTSAFVAKLETQGLLFDDRDAAADVFAILGRGSATVDNGESAIKLEHRDLLALRDAWAELPRDQHLAFGHRVGQRVKLKATWYGADGARIDGWARPVDLYLPLAIDREADSFAKSAGRAPGLKWANAEYAKLLKQKTGRSAIGAQRLLVAWGVAREPRLVRPGDERVLWQRDTSPASPVDTSMRTEDQLQSIRTGGRNTHLLEDHWSPDADAVALDIARAPAKSRRARAVALLTVLSRAWERRYSEYATAFAATAYNGYWRKNAEVRATWLARLADVKWMPDAGSSLQRPADLQMQVSGSPPRPGERSSTVAKFDGQIQRSGVLAALGVKTGPTQRDLIERLRSLHKLPVTATIAEEASAAYQLLSASLRERRDVVPEGKMSAAQLRNAFRSGPDGPGLLLVGTQWLSPEAALRGPPIFGALRAFAPNIDGLEPLWKALGVEHPKASDAISVLRELAHAVPTPVELGIAIRTLKFISGMVEEMSPQQRATLRKLPLWTGREWTFERPAYALEGEALLANAPSSMRVWRPGMTSFASIEPLLEPLGVERLGPSDFRPVSVPAYGMAEGDGVRPIFASAVALLKQELVRADQVLLDGLTIDWDQLLAAPVVIDPDLSIVADLASGPVVVPARAHLGMEPLCLIIRSHQDAGTADGAGAAVASLFDGDRQKAAWAWAAVWPRAMAGERAEGPELPKTRTEPGGGKDRLERLAQQAARRGKNVKGQSGKPASKVMVGSPPVQVRKLRDLDQLEVSSGTIVNEGAKPSGDLVIANRGRAKERTFKPGGGTSGKADRPPVRTVLPPGSDREAMALDAVRCALRLDVQQLNDLRSTRGVGVDAIDELRQCYEIKMSSSSAIPSDVTLTASEVEAARNDPDFFLAIVTGLEDGAGKLRVRFIFDPLSQLDVRVRGDLTLTGVDKAEALEFSFERASERQ